MNDLPKLQQGSTKEQERAKILEWFNSLPNYSYGMSTMHTNNPKGFFKSGGTRLLSAYRAQDGNYGGIFALPYWHTEGPSFATVENGTLSDLHQLALKDDLLSIDVKKYTSGALSKGAQKEINLTFEPRTGYTRRYFVGELTGTGSNSSLVNVHGSTLSFFAFDRDANITATILCIYTKD
jgi:hypothetical protein